MNLTPTTRNILRAYRAASPDEVAQGLAWYTRAQDLAAELDPGHVARAAAVIATLSPQASWSRNVSTARLAYRMRRADVTVFADGLPTTRITAVKAHAILQSTSDDLDDLVHGPKVRAFWRSIIEPDSDAVTIDRHAFDVAVGQVVPERIRNNVLKRVGVMETFAQAYRRAAKRAGITPAQMQAITWIYWRRNRASHKQAHQKGLWG